jgi:hypothetical protein
VGYDELRLIEQSNHRGFPPRLPGQPVFYPVLSFAYAEQIARDWNSKDSSHANVGTRHKCKVPCKPREPCSYTPKIPRPAHHPRPQRPKQLRLDRR